MLNIIRNQLGYKTAARVCPFDRIAVLGDW